MFFIFVCLLDIVNFLNVQNNKNIKIDLYRRIKEFTSRCFQKFKHLKI